MIKISRKTHQSILIDDTIQITSVKNKEGKQSLTMTVPSSFSFNKLARSSDDKKKTSSQVSEDILEKRQRLLENTKNTIASLERWNKRQTIS